MPGGMRFPPGGAKDTRFRLQSGRVRPHGDPFGFSLCRRKEMGIFDDAIREHLELKRQHGAADDELQELEDEAFGSAERPGAPGEGDSFAEAPTEFMAQPDVPVEEEAVSEEAVSVDEPEPPAPSPPGAEPAPPAEPAEEEHQAMEHELPPPPPSEDDERRALADQPTEMYDVESEFATSGEEQEADAGEEDAEAAEEEDDFFDEKSLSDELDEALDAPPEEDDEKGEVAEVDDAGQEAEGDDGRENGPEEDEDVLEETPEFLQDTPESERLWFEQRPPKDFDFDD